MIHGGGRDLKGITVSIGGDTTKLQSALAGVNKEVKNTQAQLKDAEKLLKLDQCMKMHRIRTSTTPTAHAMVEVADHTLN